MKKNQFHFVQHGHQPRPGEYGLLMLDLSAILDAKEMRCSKDDEDKKHLTILHPDGFWHVPFDRLDKLVELGFVKFQEIEDNTGISLELAMPREKCWYWVRQWDVRGREYALPKKEAI